LAYIYKITNDVNNKIYIGKTEFSIEKRFKEHCKDAFRECCEKRPLYSAMKKYGINHFHIELIEETNEPEEREKYWIEYFGSFKYGYNATVGGDGKKYLDYDLVVATYNELQEIQATANKLNISRDSVRNILQNNQVKIKNSQEINLNKYGNVINQYDLQGNYLNTYPSAHAAATAIKGVNHSPGVVSHISDVCKGKRKTAYKFIWRYADK
jgi:group I intron endonuclease